MCQAHLGFVPVSHRWGFHVASAKWGGVSDQHKYGMHSTEARHFLMDPLTLKYSTNQEFNSLTAYQWMRTKMTFPVKITAVHNVWCKVIQRKRVKWSHHHLWVQFPEDPLTEKIYLECIFKLLWIKVAAIGIYEVQYIRKWETYKKHTHTHRLMCGSLNTGWQCSKTPTHSENITYPL